MENVDARGERLVKRAVFAIFALQLVVAAWITWSMWPIKPCIEQINAVDCAPNSGRP